VEVVLCGDMVVKGKMKIEADVFSCGSTCGECDCNALLFTKKM